MSELRLMRWAASNVPGKIIDHPSVNGRQEKVALNMMSSMAEEGDIFIPWWDCRMPAWLKPSQIVSWLWEIFLWFPWVFQLLQHEWWITNDPCLLAVVLMIWYWSINIPKLAGFILRPFDKFHVAAAMLWKVVRPRGRGSATTFEHNFYWDTFSTHTLRDLWKKCNGQKPTTPNIVLLRSSRVKRLTRRNFQCTTMTKVLYGHHPWEQQSLAFQSNKALILSIALQHFQFAHPLFNSLSDKNSLNFQSFRFGSWSSLWTANSLSWEPSIRWKIDLHLGSTIIHFPWCGFNSKANCMGTPLSTWWRHSFSTAWHVSTPNACECRVWRFVSHPHGVTTLLWRMTDKMLSQLPFLKRLPTWV